MKIAIIGQKGIPAKFGGVERHVEELAIRLVGLGHDVLVYSRRNYTPKNLKEYKGIRLINLPSIPTKNLDAITHTFFSCVNLFFKKIDVIHFHSIGPSSLIWLVKILKPRTPIVATFHSQCYFHKKWGSFAKMYLKFGEWAICRLPDKTITVSRNLKKYAKDTYGINAKYVPNGVIKNEKQAPNEIKKWGLDGGDYIISVSRLIKHKGIHYLINAYNELKTNKKLVIVGDGAHTDEYVGMINKLSEKNKNIIFTGNQIGDALKELFSNAWLFVQPSESEGLSIALLEAMSYGVPVLVSDIPENLEAISDAGIIFKNKDYQSLRAELEKAENNPELMEFLSNKGIERVLKHYDWNNITAETLSLYEDVVNDEKSFFARLKLIQKAG